MAVSASAAANVVADGHAGVHSEAVDMPLPVPAACSHIEDLVLHTGGTSGNDLIFVSNSKGAIHGGEGNDQLNGQGGDDALQGDQGVDVCIGGDGTDAFKTCESATQ